MTNNFKNDVLEGLRKTSKTLPSKYFYDAIGDKIFIEIMNMPEYYLTKAELDIFKNKTQQIIDNLQLNKKQYFELVELGAGDGTKTKELLKELLHQNFDFSYLPIDISKDSLNHLEKKLKNELPKLNVISKQGDYFEILDSLNKSDIPKVVLFLGSNIGNMTDENAKVFIKKLGDSLQKNDKVLLGVDLIKSEAIVLPAYDDKNGITKRFNLNLLNRINKELAADFNIFEFNHTATYKEEEGIARSFLVSGKNQKVTFKNAEESFIFKKGEKIHTETSRKYNDEILKEILDETNLIIKEKLMDTKEYFADYILVKS